ncbi:MAG: arylesterase [Proteobacteria bacterium]|nr:arylesterase [Pseudomonadota bacterium]
MSPPTQPLRFWGNRSWATLLLLLLTLTSTATRAAPESYSALADLQKASIEATKDIAATVSDTSGAAKILVLGDSISAGYGMNIDDGWVNLMNQALAQRESRWQLINASISGETTTGGLRRLPELLQQHQPDIVVLELGGNDGLRGYPTTKISSNLLAMTDLVRGANAKPIIITMRIPANYGLRYTRAFEQVFADVAEQSEAALVPFLFEAFALDPELMQDDGIHPTAKAQPLLVDGFLPYLEPLM